MAIATTMEPALKNRTVRGSILYNTWSAPIRDAEGLSFRERISPRAFAESLKRGDSIPFLLNHRGRPYATSNDLMSLVDGPDELEFGVTLMAEDSRAMDLFRLATDGSVNGVSFGFRCMADSWDSTGYSRTVEMADLTDISLVTSSPAYPDFSFEARHRRRPLYSYLGAHPLEFRAAHLSKIEQDLEDSHKLPDYMRSDAPKQLRQRAVLEAARHFSGPLSGERLAEFRQALNEYGPQ